MLNRNQLHTHVWMDGAATPHQVHQDGGLILHQRCGPCFRDFGLGFEGLYNWEVIYVRVLRIERLATSVTES